MHHRDDELPRFSPFTQLPFREECRPHGRLSFLVDLELLSWEGASDRGARAFPGVVPAAGVGEEQLAGRRRDCAGGRWQDGDVGERERRMGSFGGAVPWRWHREVMGEERGGARRERLLLCVLFDQS